MSHAISDEEFRARVAAYNTENPRANRSAPPLEVISGGTEARKSKSRIRLVPFKDIKLGTERRYLVKGLIPRTGLVIVWGPPKCGKSFWTFDLVMHVALGWEYRGRRVQQGPIVYCAFEGQKGFEARVEAFRQQHLDNKDIEDVPFHLQPVTLDLVRDGPGLVEAIRSSLGQRGPVAVVLDTLNRSLRGSESSDEDMSEYVRAADAIRETFDCAVIIVHHCGVEGTRPRGHTSLTGAADAQISVKRDYQKNIIAEVECAKDGPQGDQIVSKLEDAEVGTDEDGEPITSCHVVPAEAAEEFERGPSLSKNQSTLFQILFEAGASGLTIDEWNDRAREAGIGVRRRADLTDCRIALKAKGMIYEHANGWSVKR